MIGVIADPAEREVVCEFFELFKTPWEFYRQDGHYDVVLCGGDRRLDTKAKLTVVYSGHKTQVDDEQKIPLGRLYSQPRILAYQGDRLPLYGETVTFVGKGACLLTIADSSECGVFRSDLDDRVLARIGYDLFGEIRLLLTAGQPAVNAAIPALELHIALLKDLITGTGISVVEIPAVPDGYQFIACLTHDVDHPSIRAHKWDHTVLGFLYRAVLGSCVEVLRGHMPIQDLLANWVAAVKLPFVFLGFSTDFWGEFGNQYLQLEAELPSTFFVIPFKDYPGRRADGPAPAFRASRYSAKDIADTLQKLITGGREVGLHGLDAWLDSGKGSEELEEIRRLTGFSEIGVRMHWLYFASQSPAVLEKAGAAYDSTVGYNETVGYRAGTTQVYRLFDTSQLLELPMHAMDTALFYLSYLGLSPRKVSVRLRQMADIAVQYGGCFTINWHDRSLAPERLWGGCYRDLIDDLRSRGAWFSTAGQAVSWFRKRRSATFEIASSGSGAVRVKLAVLHPDNLPGLKLRTHKAQKPSAFGTRRSEEYVDVAVEQIYNKSVPS